MHRDGACLDPRRQNHDKVRAASDVERAKLLAEKAELEKKIEK